MDYTRNGRISVVFLGWVLLVGVMSPFGIHPASAQTAGGFANAMSAGAISRGGTMAAERGDPLDAVEGNPAGLAGLRTPVLDASGVGLLAIGSYQNSVDNSGHLTGNAGALAYGAFGIPLGKSPWIASIGISPDALIGVNWRYVDPPGTAGASYGLTTNRSRTIAMRTSVGLARTLGPKLAAGATVGLVYNTNTLQAPYVFQQQPQLAGLKVLLDLHTRGFGWSGSVGAQWKPTDRLCIGAAWKSPTFVQSHGDVSGTAAAQFLALGITTDPIFHYRAEVDNQFPQNVAIGASWQANKRLRLGLEGNWVNWADAFKQLPIKLTDGTNTTINSVVGSHSLLDFYPFHWRNQGVIRAGLENSLSHGWVVRGGYSYMSDPVPGSTLMPLASAIMKNSLAGGAGWSREHWHWSGAYQIELPTSQSNGKSELLAGEFSNIHLLGTLHSLTVSARVNF